MINQWRYNIATGSVPIPEFQSSTTYIAKIYKQWDVTGSINLYSIPIETITFDATIGIKPYLVRSDVSGTSSISIDQVIATKQFYKFSEYYKNSIIVLSAITEFPEQKILFNGVPTLFVTGSAHNIDWILNAPYTYPWPGEAPENAAYITGSWPNYELTNGHAWGTPNLNIQLSDPTIIYNTHTGSFDDIRSTFLLKELDYFAAKQLYEKQLENPEISLRIVDTGSIPPEKFKHLITRCQEFQYGTIQPGLDYTSRSSLSDLNDRFRELDAVINAVSVLYPNITISSGEGQPYSASNNN